LSLMVTEDGERMQKAEWPAESAILAMPPSAH
jgi:hypothetical protein